MTNESPTVSLRDALEAIIRNSYVGKGDKPVMRSKYANYPAHLYHTAKVALAASPAHTPAPDTTETWESINQWCDDTFGKATIPQIIARAKEEFDELEGPDADHAIEAADVVICLCRIPGFADALQRKMAINRKRKWRLVGNGTGYHVPEAPAPDTRLVGARCLVPPDGWWCSRAAGHEGPCAARPIQDLAAGGLEAWKALPDDERNGERPWIMGFNAGWSAALCDTAENPAPQFVNEYTDLWGKTGQSPATPYTPHPAVEVTEKRAREAFDNPVRLAQIEKQILEDIGDLGLPPFLPDDTEKTDIEWAEYEKHAAWRQDAFKRYWHLASQYLDRSKGGNQTSGDLHMICQGIALAMQMLPRHISAMLAFAASASTTEDGV